MLSQNFSVARIGVISGTGKRALYVRIGNRVINNGVSYMQFKEYVEIIQEEIRYYDPGLFIAGIHRDEPPNYIHARKNPDDLNSIVHSTDSPATEDDNRWTDRAAWPQLPGQSGLTDPDKWHTHYLCWPFKSIKSIETRTKAINQNCLFQKSTAMEIAPLTTRVYSGLCWKKRSQITVEIR